MKYIVAMIILLFGYYPFSYGIYQWKKQNNKLGGFGTILFAVICTIYPLIVFLINN